jgi:hypothetical protein
MISTQTIVADAKGNPTLEPSMQDAITGYLRARDQLLLSMDGLDAYRNAVHLLYVTFVQDTSITDHRILCGAFQAFRKILTRQQDAYQKLKTEN